MKNMIVSPTSRAALWMFGAICCFTTMAIAGRSASSELDTFEIMLWRSLIGLAIVLSISTLFQTRKTIRAAHMGTHLKRNLGHFTGQNLWFFALTAAPLAQVFALEFTSPIWVILLAPFILRESLTAKKLLVALIGFLGVLIVAQPWSAPPSIGLMTAALSAIGFALSAIYTRKLTQTESITSILFWLSVMQFVFALICAGIDGDINTPSQSALPFVALIACAGLFAHFCLSTALSIVPASVAMPFDFLRLPVVIVIGALYYSESVSLSVLVGGAIIFGASYLNILVAQSTSK